MADRRTCIILPHRKFKSIACRTMKLISVALLLACFPSAMAQTNSTANQTIANVTNATTPDTANCPCLFDGSDDDDCIVYGSLDGDLKAWPTADQTCLDAYTIKVDAPDPTLTCSSANAFVNALKLGALSSSKAKFGLGIPYGGFFDESTVNSDIPVLKDTIPISGTSYDCKSSESTCYNAMKPYFESDSDGIKEKKDVCDKLKGDVLVARETEQSIVRVRICAEYREPATILSACSDMFDAMEGDLKKFNDKTCGGFGTGPGSRTLPGCGGASRSSPASNLERSFSLAMAFAGGVVGLLMLA